MLLTVDQNYFCIGIVENKRDVVGAIIHKQRHRHQAVRERTLIGDDPMDTVLQHDRHAFTRR